MKRREIVAGVASVGVLGGAGAVLWRGVPFATDDADATDNQAESDDNGEGDEASSGPIEVRTLDAPGSDAGTITVPNDGVTLAVFFSPVCHRCRSLMPDLGDAHARLTDEYGDELTVVSVTAQQSEDQLRDWWEEYDGNWTLAYDPDRSLITRYDVVTHPVLAAIDETGTVRWTEEGELEADRIVREVERVLEARSDDG